MITINYKRVLLHALTALLASIVSSHQDLHADTQPQLIVAIIAPLSGPAASFGNSVVVGMKLGLGTTLENGQTKLLIEDDQLQPAKTVSAFQALTTTEKVDLIISVGASSSNAIAALANQAQIPLLAAASDTRAATDRPWVIRTWCSGQEEGAAIAEELQKHAIKKAALLVTPSDYHFAIRSGIQSTIASDYFVFNQEVPTGTTDFRPLLLKIKESQGEALVALLNPGMNALLAQQLKELHINLLQIGGIQLEDKHEQELAKGALNGALYVTAATNISAAAENESKLREVSATSLAAVHYELGKLVAQFVRTQSRDGMNSRDKLKTYLMQQTLENSTLGTTSFAKKNGEQFLQIGTRISIVPDWDPSP